MCQLHNVAFELLERLLQFVDDARRLSERTLIGQTMVLKCILKGLDR